MGDQVYLDLPTIADFVDDPVWLSEHFEQSYLENWTGETGYSKVLQAAPFATLPDDHEYWNNFPHPSPFIGNTYSAKGRRTWQVAAQGMYQAFQQVSDGNLKQAVELDVKPLSFFLLDTRTFRKSDRSQTVDPAMRQQFSNWVTRIIDTGQYGVIASGQSFFDEAARGLSGSAGDRTLANYKDFDLLCDDLLRLVRAGRPALCLTGDVHWGRVFEAQERYMEPGRLYEVISSPSSLVTTIGKDQIKHAVDWVKSLVGKSIPWPRHAEAADPSSLLLQGHLQAVKTLHKQKGNHVVMLSFRRSGFGLNLDITYHPVPDRGQRMPPLALPTIQFTPLT
ncbi:metallophosphoesterase family protein [Hymenobacter tenuis]